jgi:hypothetical protein
MSVESPQRPAAGPRLCPHCGAPLAPDQDWCLECGTAATTRVVAPPSWRVPAAVIVAVLVAFAIAVAIAVSVLSSDSDHSVAPIDHNARAAVPAGPPVAIKPVSVPVSPAKAKAKAKSATAATGDSGATGATGATSASGASGATGTTGDVGLWDPAKQAYTVVLITSDRTGAEKVAKQSASSAQTKTGILDTSKYQFFSPGLWVAWAGQFDAKPDAQKLADKIAKGGRKGYVTLVKKK